MKTRRVLVVTVLALALSLAFAASAFATVIPVPDAGYLADTTKIDLTPYYWNGAGWPPPPVPAITDGTLTVAFSAPEMFAAYAPDAGATDPHAWGDDGVVEATTPTAGRTATYAPWAGGGPVTTFNLNKLVKTFGFEMSSIWQGAGASGYTATVDFKRGGAVIDTVTKTIPAPEGSTLATLRLHSQFFAATDPTGFDQVVITLSGGAPTHEWGAYVGQYRYDLPDPVVVDSSASSAWSIAVLAAAAVALFAVGRKKYLVHH